ncbi:MAG TPA: gamma-glutamylcyclotransferase family protein [Baekduia sp.]|nr:gamma-glutamylcyclotransferase family protein [Baekduia sp.]
MPLVFAYGSLTGLPGRPAVLPGARRTWGVAMDNRQAIPGYKRFLDPATGEAPPVHVAFADLEDGDGDVDGVLLEVDAAGLRTLDARERNYERIDVSHRFDGAGRVWTYRGSAAGRRRAARGRAAGDLVVVRSYAAAAGLAPDGLPVLDLVRVDL